MSASKRSRATESEAEEVDLGSGSEGEEEKKSSKGLAPFTSTEQDEEDAWNAERDEAAEARELAAQLSAAKPAKKRRLQKASEVEAQAKSLSYRSGLLEDDPDDFVVDDLGVGVAGDDDYDVARDKKLLTSIAVQDAFQPGATPFQGGVADTRGDMRFLAYNAVGNITTLEEKSMAAVAGEESEEADKIHIVQLNYTDTTKHKASKFRDYYGFKMAALGQHGAVFASQRGWDKKEKKELPSTVFYRPSDSWDKKTSAEWILHFPLTGSGAHKEEVVGVALGDTFVAVASSKQYVRVMSHTGIQLVILSIPGPVVSMVGQAGLLAVVYHAGVPLPGHQNLGCMLIDIVKRREVHRGALAISPRSTLTWIGFSDLHHLMSMDSYGVLRALAKSWGGAMWTPVLETSHLRGAVGVPGGVGASDSHWPVSVIGETLMALVLGEGKKFPTAGKRSSQSLVSVQLQLPFLALDQPVAQHEEQHARHALQWYDDVRGPFATASRFYDSRQEVEQDKLVLALFQRALKGDFLARALDLATMLYKRKSLEVAAQMANHEKKTALVDRLQMLLPVKFPTHTARGGALDDDEVGAGGGVAGFLDMDTHAAAASSSAPRRKLIRPAVSFDDAEADNMRANEDDEGEAEYDFGASKGGILKASQSSATPSSTPFSSGSLAMRSNVKSANVKPKQK